MRQRERRKEEEIRQLLKERREDYEQYMAYQFDYLRVREE
jgi:hypothetical protein